MNSFGLELALACLLRPRLRERRIEKPSFENQPKRENGIDWQLF
jgi:hypothetical protein